MALTFTSEAESQAAGFTRIEIVLPEGISADAVKVKKAPAGWTLTPSGRGYTVGGKALAAGTDAVHSITVAQLPDAASLVFKTVETYGDGTVSRWIEVPSGGQEPENPAPVLELKAAAPDATPLAPSPTPSARASAAPSAPATSPAEVSASPKPAAGTDSGDGPGTGVVIGIVAAVLLAAGGATAWWLRRRSA